MGLAWIVTLFMRISCRGRYLSSTGTFSIASSVLSAPSITLSLAIRWYCKHDEQEMIAYLLAEHCIFCIKVCMLSVCNVKLGAVGVRSRICHGYDSTGVVLWER